MRILNEIGEEINREACDLTVGELRPETIIRPDATPIDNETKHAWADEDYEDILRYVVVPDAERREQRVAALKANLAATDYVVIKIAEGAATAEEYAAVITDREAWRKEINTLERQIKEANENE